MVWVVDPHTSRFTRFSTPRVPSQVALSGLASRIKSSKRELHPLATEAPRALLCLDFGVFYAPPFFFVCLSFYLGLFLE